MTPIGEADVRKVARLARLSLEEDEVERLVGELGTILDHVSRLPELDESGVHERDLASRLRPDVEDPDPLARDLSEIAPDWRRGFFVVPPLAGLAVEGAYPGAEADRAAGSEPGAGEEGR